MQYQDDLDPKVASKGFLNSSHTIIPHIQGYVKRFRKPL